jgi:hypothetical protein
MPREHEVIVADNKAVDEGFDGFRGTIYLPDDLQGYGEVWRACEDLRMRAGSAPGSFNDWKAMMRLWSAGDWYFRLIFVMTFGRDAWSVSRGEPHFRHPVHIDIARWCQFGDQDRTYLIASRGIGKSSHLTHNDQVGQVLLDPNFAGCIFSHTKEYAQKHLSVLMEELRKNDLLKILWPDRFFSDPDEDAPLFSIKDGINVKRATTRLEPTFSAHAFVSRLPTGSHFDKRYYDDIEVDDTVESEDTMDKVEDRYVSSQDLSSSQRRKAVCGTYYHPNGPLRRLELKYGMTPKVWPSENRTPPLPPPEERAPGGGRPANGFTLADLNKIINDKGGRNSAIAMRSYSRQYLSDPKAGEAAKLNRDYIQTYEGTPVEIGQRCNIYVTQDPSAGITDPTWTWVWGLHPDGNYYWLDGWRRRCTPGRRLADTYLTALRWNGIGNLLEVRIESYGQGGYAEAQAEHFVENGFGIPVVKIADSRSGSKREREYEAWEPPLHEGRIYFPRVMMRQDETGGDVDLVSYFLDNELGPYPLPTTDDGLDGGGLLWAKAGGPLEWPQKREQRVWEEIPDRFGGGDGGGYAGALAGGIL